MPKNLPSDEIDLIDVIKVIWDKKFQVILFVIFSLVVTIIYELNQPPSKISAITEVKPITVYDEEKYKIYNSFLNTIQPYYVLESVVKLNSPNDNQKLKDHNILNKTKSVSISEINKKFLLDLFIDRLNERTYMVDSIKNFGLIKRENYGNKLDYEEAVSSLASSIKISKIELDSFIAVETYDIENWEDFLEYIEKKANLEIQIKLSELFENYILFAKSIRDFKIEDIKTQLPAAINEEEKINLENRMNILSENKYIDRLQRVFENSPVAINENFYAARILYNSTSYKLKDVSGSKVPKLMVSAICGAIFGIFFVLIANAIQKRK
jgi:hypothetical protein